LEPSVKAIPPTAAPLVFVQKKTARPLALKLSLSLSLALFQ